MISNLTSGNFAIVVSGAGDMVVVFLAANDGGCLSYKATVMNAVAQSSGELSFGSIFVNEFPEIARANKIINIPTINAYRDGELIKQITGIYTTDVLVKAFGIIYNN
jgi:thioredoxin-like negative regulator of GroEL